MSAPLPQLNAKDQTPLEQLDFRSVLTLDGTSGSNELLDMRTVTLDEAVEQWSKLLDLVELGEEFIIERDGKPVAVVEAYQKPSAEPVS